MHLNKLRELCTKQEVATEIEVKIDCLCNVYEYVANNKCIMFESRIAFSLAEKVRDLYNVKRTAELLNQTKFPRYVKNIFGLCEGLLLMNNSHSKS